MIIIGAGLAGLLAARYFRHHSPVVLETQGAIPHNHRALLRFRSNIVGETSGIPLRKVHVQKAVMERDGTLSDRATLLHQNAYSRKVTGSILPRSIMNLAPAERYVAPDDFTRELAKGTDIRYNYTATLSDLRRHRENGDTIISTIPMPAMMDLFGVAAEQRPEFRRKAITSVWTCMEGVDVYQTIYNPWHDLRFTPIDDRREYGEGPGPYRISTSGNQLIMEYAYQPNPAEVNAQYEAFCIRLFDHVPQRGAFSFKHQPYGKIMPIDDAERKSFIIGLTDEFGIYSLGRFATWRQILLDDVAEDLRVIDSLMQSRSAYARRLHYGAVRKPAA